MQCMMGAMSAGATATGLRAWLVARQPRWLTPGRQRRLTYMLLANDRGIFWADAHTVLAGITEDAGMWIDVVADIRAKRRAVVIKAGGQPAGRMACYEAAIAAGPPQPADGWRPGRRTTKPATFTVWRIDATDKTASETAQLALDARAFMTDLADPAQQGVAASDPGPL